MLPTLCIYSYIDNLIARFRMDKFLIEKRKAVECDVNKIEDDVHKTCKRKVCKPHLYSEYYMKLGFTFFSNENNPCPLCLVCGDKLANEGMVSNKLKHHFTTKHDHLSEKPVEYFIQLSKSIKKAVYSIHKENRDIRQGSRS